MFADALQRHDEQRVAGAPAAAHDVHAGESSASRRDEGGDAMGTGDVVRDGVFPWRPGDPVQPGDDMPDAAHDDAPIEEDMDIGNVVNAKHINDHPQ